MKLNMVVASVLVVSLCGLFNAPQASAANRAGIRGIHLPKAGRVAIKAPRIKLPSRNQVQRFASGLNQRGRSVQNHGRPLQDALQNIGRAYGQNGSRYGMGNQGGYPLLREWQNALMNQYGGQGYGHGGYGHGYGYGGQDEFAKAYRDAAIVNSIAQVVTSLAVINQQQRTLAPAPAPAYVQPSQQPAGYYATERVLVSPGHYEEVKAWVPEGMDPQTGVKTGGYYEVRQRWVPDVYEYRPAWVGR